MQRKIRLKPFVISFIYVVCTITLVVSLMMIGRELLKSDTPISYITTSTITEEVKPVVAESKKIQKPYQDEDVVILQNYYDYKDEKEKQEKSLILYENTYLQNSGIDYGKEESFDVTAIYAGIVLDIKEDDILGKIVEIEHSNNLIASYQCLKDIKVKKGDTLIEKDIIGTSGTCNISKDLGNHLHLEISNNGKMINPESIYDKNIEELE